MPLGIWFWVTFPANRAKGQILASSKETKYSVCTVCDIGCQLRTEAVDGKVSRVIAQNNPALAHNIQASDWKTDAAVEEHAAR